MQCPDCQTVLKPAAQLKTCPICGHIFESSQTKPSFEKTWGLICQEELRKHPSPQKFEETWNWYKQDLERHPKDPIALRDAARFLKTCSSYSTLPILWPSWMDRSNLPQSVLAYWPQAPWIAFLWLSMLAGDGSSGLQLYWLNDPEVRNDLRQALQSLTELKQEETLFTSDQAMLSLLASALKGEGAQARQIFRFLQKMDPEEELILTTPKAFELLSGVSTTLDGRLHDLQGFATLEKSEDLEVDLNFLYRPLTINPVSFDHLNCLPEEYIAFLISHKEAWQQKTYAMIQADTVLRGIHLALQTIQSTHPELESICQSLLEAQYIKAYLRPFEQIEKSDVRF